MTHDAANCWRAVENESSISPGHVVRTKLSMFTDDFNPENPDADWHQPRWTTCGLGPFERLHFVVKWPCCDLP
jgi:hypothetical protein